MAHWNTTKQGEVESEKVRCLYFCVVFLLLCSWAGAKSIVAPGPFDLATGKTSYEEALNNARQRNWICQEYEKRHFKPIGKKDPARGKNTFVKATPEGMEGINSILIFFNGESTLAAVIIVLDPELSDVVFQEMDGKYKLVENSLKGEHLSTGYPYAVWQKDNILIELQRPSPYRTRLLYVEKALYENYREFLNKHYPRYRHTQEKKGWMDEL